MLETILKLFVYCDLCVYIITVVYEKKVIHIFFELILLPINLLIQMGCVQDQSVTAHCLDKGFLLSRLGCG